MKVQLAARLRAKSRKTSHADIWVFKFSLIQKYEKHLTQERKTQMMLRTRKQVTQGKSIALIRPWFFMFRLVLLKRFASTAEQERKRGVPLWLNIVPNHYPGDISRMTNKTPGGPSSPLPSCDCFVGSGLLFRSFATTGRVAL